MYEKGLRNIFIYSYKNVPYIPFHKFPKFIPRKLRRENDYGTIFNLKMGSDESY